MKKRVGLYLAGVMALAIVARAANIIYNAKLTNETALAYNNTYSVDLLATGIGSLSAQATYSSATVPTAQFQDGAQATGGFTVLNYAALKAASATDSITVVSTTGLVGATINVPGFVFSNGIDWATGADANATAASLAAALATVPYLSVSHSGNVVYATATAGSFYNTYAVLSNNANLSIASPLFTGGQDNAWIAINGARLNQGMQWTAATSNAATASSLASAINAASSLNKKLKAQASGAVVASTSTLNGAVYNYPLQTSTPTALSASGARMTGGANAAFSLGGNVFSSPANGLTLALPVLYTQGSAAIGGLADQTTYYAIPTSAGSFMLSTSQSGALAGTGLVVVTSTNTQLPASQHTYTLAPLGITGVPSFKWEASNDSVNWIDLNVSSVTMGPTGTPYSVPPTSTLWSFGFIGTRYLRLNAVAPATGGILLQVQLIGTN